MTEETRPVVPYAVARLGEALLAQPLRAARIHLDGNWIFLFLTIGNHEVSVRLYTAGGAEPDPYVAITLDGEQLLDEGGYAVYGPFVLGSLPLADSRDPVFWNAHRRIDQQLVFERGALVTGIRFNNTEFMIATGKGVLVVTGGMEDMLKPAAPAHFTLAGVIRDES